MTLFPPCRYLLLLHACFVASITVAAPSVTQTLMRRLFFTLNAASRPVVFIRFRAACTVSAVYLLFLHACLAVSIDDAPLALSPVMLRLGRSPLLVPRRPLWSG